MLAAGADDQVQRRQARVHSCASKSSRRSRAASSSPLRGRSRQAPRRVQDLLAAAVGERQREHHPGVAARTPRAAPPAARARSGQPVQLADGVEADAVVEDLRALALEVSRSSSISPATSSAGRAQFWEEKA